MYIYTIEADKSIMIHAQTSKGDYARVQWLQSERDTETFHCLLKFGGIDFACRHFVAEIE